MPTFLQLTLVYSKRLKLKTIKIQQTTVEVKKKNRAVGKYVYIVLKTC